MNFQTPRRMSAAQRGQDRSPAGVDARDAGQRAPSRKLRRLPRPSDLSAAGAIRRSRPWSSARPSRSSTVCCSPTRVRTGFRWGPFGDVVGVVRIEGADLVDRSRFGGRDCAPGRGCFRESQRQGRRPGRSTVPVGAGWRRIHRHRLALKRKTPSEPVVAGDQQPGASAASLDRCMYDKIVAGRYP